MGYEEYLNYREFKDTIFVWKTCLDNDGYTPFRYKKTETITKSKIPDAPNETPTEKVIRYLKGDFEKQIGMSFDEFTKIRNEIIESSPEKLI